MIKITKKTIASVMLMAGFLFVSGVSQAAELVMIANPSVGLSSISAKDAKKLFLGKAKTVNGEKLKAIGLAEGQPARDLFFSNILKMNATEVKNHWVTESLKGGAKPPKSMKTVKSLIKYVGKKKGAIGYITSDKSGDATAAGLKTLAIN